MIMTQPIVWAIVLNNINQSSVSHNLIYCCVSQLFMLHQVKLFWRVWSCSLRWMKFYPFEKKKKLVLNLPFNLFFLFFFLCGFVCVFDETLNTKGVTFGVVI